MLAYWDDRWIWVEKTLERVGFLKKAAPILNILSFDLAWPFWISPCKMVSYTLSLRGPQIVENNT